MNNKLFIIDDETGDTFKLANSLGSNWYTWGDDEEFIEKLKAFLAEHDFTGSIHRKPTSLRLVTEAELMQKEREAQQG